MVVGAYLIVAQFIFYSIYFVIHGGVASSLVDKTGCAKRSDVDDFDGIYTMRQIHV